MLCTVNCHYTHYNFCISQWTRTWPSMFTRWLRLLKGWVAMITFSTPKGCITVLTIPRLLESWSLCVKWLLRVLCLVAISLLDFANYYSVCWRLLHRFFSTQSEVTHMGARGAHLYHVAKYANAPLHLQIIICACVAQTWVTPNFLTTSWGVHS